MTLAKTEKGPRIYVAGPMQGKPLLNYDAFDNASSWLRMMGWHVVSPAEIDRELGMNPKDPETWLPRQDLLHRDLHEITHPCMEALVLLPEWVYSPGAKDEVETAMRCGHTIYLYEPSGVFAGDGWNSNQRLVEISHDLVRATIRAAEEQEEADQQYFDDGAVRVTSSTGGAKGQKDLRYDLIPSESLKEVAKVYGHGAKKYAPNNWMLGYDYSLSLAALERHLHDWKQGEQIDPEGFHHLAAVIFHACTLIYRDKFQPEWDDVHEAG